MIKLRGYNLHFCLYFFFLSPHFILLHEDLKVNLYNMVYVIFPSPQEKNKVNIPSVFSLLTLFSLQSNIGAFRLHLFCFKNDLRIKMFSTIKFLGKNFYFFVFDYISKNALKIILWYLMRSKIKLKKSFSFFILGKIKILLTFSKKKKILVNINT